jgi:ABC-type transporter Mla subunit MlaD
MVPVIDNVRQVTERLADPEAGVQKTLKDLGEVAASIRVMTDKIGRLAEDGSRLTHAVPAQIDPLLGDARRSVAQVETLLRQLNQELPPAMDEARKTLQGARAATESLQRVLAEDVPRVLRRGEASLDEADEVVGGVRRSWPVKAMLPQPEAKVIELDSADGQEHAKAGKRAP